MGFVTIGFFEIAWPSDIRHAPTPEQLLDDGRVDGIVAIFAPHWSDTRIRRAMRYYATRRLPIEPDKVFSNPGKGARPVINLKTGESFPSVSALALTMGCDPGPICRAIKRGLPYRGVSAVYKDIRPKRGI